MASASPKILRLSSATLGFSAEQCRIDGWIEEVDWWFIGDPWRSLKDRRGLGEPRWFCGLGGGGLPHR